jgi:hypothetical protein
MKTEIARETQTAHLNVRAAIADVRNQTGDCTF